MPLIDTARRMRAAFYALALVVTVAAGMPAQAETTELNERRSAKTFLEYLGWKAALYRSNYAADDIPYTPPPRRPDIIIQVPR